MDIEKLKDIFMAEVSKISSLADLEGVRLKYLGKKGIVPQLPKSADMKLMKEDERRVFGKIFNSLKEFVEAGIAEAKNKFSDVKEKSIQNMDITLPGSARSLGSLHPITLVQLELESIFSSMGFMVLTGFDVETEHYNFDSLNMPADHPARDMQDTFWLTNGMLLRTQTSANQVRALEKYGAPLRAVFPGRCFRPENLDAGHENTFYQFEGLMVDKNVSIANLISVMKILLKGIFHKDIEIRLRQGFFPFVEPGFELDVKCVICEGRGCPTCKKTGWLELLPCGLVHPKVLKNGGMDPEVWSGFAFGLGLTRLAMMKYKISDIRMMNSCDIRSLEQFKPTI